MEFVDEECYGLAGCQPAHLGDQRQLPEGAGVYIDGFHSDSLAPQEEFEKDS